VDALLASSRVDSARVLESIDTLAGFGARPDGGVDRPALSALDRHARRHLLARALALGCTVRTDACANLFIRRAGTEDASPVMTGSHIDTQPTGGKLDGCYGVLAGMECIAAFNDAALRTRRPLEVVIWTNEEGCRFAPGAMGSSAFVSPALLERYRLARDASGMSVAEALSEHRAEFPSLTERAAGIRAHAYLELHIEQGPVLEQSSVALGLVNGIQGVRWFELQCEGVAAHAGTTPMSLRHDAMTLAIALRAEIEALAVELGGSQTRITFGRWSVLPNVINTIPSAARFTVDFRHPDAAVLEAFDRGLSAFATRHSAACQPLFSHQPVEFSRALLAQLAATCAALRVPSLTLTSGAFHDAMYLAQHCPSAMLFVPSRGGISHSPQETTNDEHLVLGVRALAHTLLTLCNEP
jgi:N-carbamoyl-L-amino-acid hydrolase